MLPPSIATASQGFIIPISQMRTLRLEFRTGTRAQVLSLGTLAQSHLQAAAPPGLLHSPPEQAQNCRVIHTRPMSMHAVRTLWHTANTLHAPFHPPTPEPAPAHHAYDLLPQKPTARPLIPALPCPHAPCTISLLGTYKHTRNTRVRHGTLPKGPTCPCHSPSLPPPLFLLS